MKGYKQYILDNELVNVPVFEVGDRVTLPENNRSDIMEPNVYGTVFNIASEWDGLFVDVKWDKDKYTSIDGGEVVFGARRLAINLKLKGEKDNEKS